MVAPLIPIIAGAVARTTAVRLLAGNKGNDLLRDRVKSSVKGKIQGLNINVSANIKEVTRQLSRTQKRQIPFATSRALNDTAFSIARKDLPRFADRIFTGGAVPFTKRGFKFIKSNKRKGTTNYLTAFVFIDKLQGSYMKFQVDGGVRKPKRKAILIPTNKLRVNKYGNITRATRSNIINNKSKYFKGVPKGRFGEVYEGIWERSGDNQKIRMVAKYKDDARYNKKFPFPTIVEKLVNNRTKGFRARFEQRLREALASAR
jgi:hypothetical protein